MILISDTSENEGSGYTSYIATPRNHNRTTDDPFCSQVAIDKDDYQKEPCGRHAVLRLKFWRSSQLFDEPHEAIDACDVHREWLKKDHKELIRLYEEHMKEPLNYDLIELIESN